MISETLQLGTVGWDNYPTVYDMGTSGGPSYVFVTLFSGRDVSKTHTPDRCQGQQIVVRVPSNMMSLPPAGTEVLVAFPDGMNTKVGAGIMIAAVSRVASDATYGPLQEGELCIHPGNADAKNRILMKKDGSFSAYTTDSSGGSMAFTLDATAGSASMLTPNGALSIQPDGTIVMINGQSALQLGADGNVHLNCVTFTINGQQFTANVGTTFLGTTAAFTPANAAIHGPSGITGIGSSSVYIGV